MTIAGMMKCRQSGGNLNSSNTPASAFLDSGLCRNDGKGNGRILVILPAICHMES